MQYFKHPLGDYAKLLASKKKRVVDSLMNSLDHVRCSILNIRLETMQEVILTRRVVHTVGQEKYVVHSLMSSLDYHIWSSILNIHLGTTQGSNINKTRYRLRASHN